MQQREVKTGDKPSDCIFQQTLIYGMSINDEFICKTLIGLALKAHTRLIIDTTTCCTSIRHVIVKISIDRHKFSKYSL